MSYLDQDRLLANQLRDSALRLLSMRLIDDAAEALASCLGADAFGQESFAELAVATATEALALDKYLDPPHIDHSRTILVRALAYLGISAGLCSRCAARPN